MDDHRYETLLRILSRIPTRRDVLCGLVGAGLLLGVAQLAAAGEAKRRRDKKGRKKQPKPLKPNMFGCLDGGVACKRSDQCCSNPFLMGTNAVGPDGVVCPL